ncbi:VC0807 family protein [Mesorhizobium carmichaelinearum]|uniref:VC0807 family protein n=1 Tax=Mesorhizobium carmichaelinearum TaxID=1208188 RepID=UPI000BA4AA46|nr:VC0807 family protein [Mesorhizobium carmichaelinearum]
MRIRAGLVVELGVNLLLPWLAYRMALPHFGTIGALYASAVPPVAWGLIEFARFRRVDALSALVLLGIALSLMVMALGGSARLLLLRESLVSGAIGVVFLLSLAFRKPMVFYLARATVAREREYGQEHFEALWRERPSLRTSIRLMTLIWGAGLSGETMLRSWLAWHWPIERYLVVSPVIGYGIYGGLTLWSIWYRTRMKQRGEAAAGDGTPSPS